MTLTLFIELFIETQLHSRGHYVDVLLYWTALLQALLRIKMIWLDGPVTSQCWYRIVWYYARMAQPNPLFVPGERYGPPARPCTGRYYVLIITSMLA